MHIFIDTNVFLSFYYFTSDDLEELKKLIVLIEKSQAKLWLPSQVEIEFRRNRDNKIAEAIKSLREQKLNLQFPAICKDYEEYQELRQQLNRYERIHATLTEKIKTDIANESLKADETIKRLFDTATKIEVTDEITAKAIQRHNIGNPPGKKDSFGDAINWEALLKEGPNAQAMYFITDDKDYYSPLGENVFNSFLLGEWKDVKVANLKAYRSISVFFREHFPEIKLATELEKDLHIKDFANSFSFARTHSLVAILSSYIDFTNAQINDIITATVNNWQIYGVINDKDVKTFISTLIKDKEDKIESANLARLKKLLNPPNAAPLILDDFFD